MTTATFDAVEYMKKLRNADFTQEQAETIAQETERIVEVAVNSAKSEIEKKDLATKQDIELAIALIESRLIKWLIGVGLVSTTTLGGAIFTMLKLMLHQG